MWKPCFLVPSEAQNSCRKRLTAATRELGLQIVLLTNGLPALLAVSALLLGSEISAAQQPSGCAPNTATYPCVYVSNGRGDTVSIINATTNKVIGAVTVGKLAQGIAVTPDNKSVYVAVNGNGTVAVLDAATSTITATVTGLSGQALSQIAITPDGKSAYIVEPGSDFSVIDRIDTSTNTVVDSVTGITYPLAITFSPNGEIAYVSDRCPTVDLACLDIVDTTSTPPRVINSPVEIPNTGFSAASSIVISQDGSLVCMTVVDPNLQLEIAFVSTSDNTVSVLGLGVISNLTNYGLGITPNGILYAAEPAGLTTPLNTVASVSTSPPALLNPVQVGLGPTGVAVGPGGNSVYVTNNSDSTVSIIDAKTNAVLTLGSGNGFSGPQGVAAMTAIPPVITTQPASRTILPGATAPLSVVATSAAPATLQWYQGGSGDTSTPIEGASGSSFTTPVLSATTSYWVQVTNVAGLVNSNTATVTVSTNQPPTCTLTVDGAGSQTFTNPLGVIATATCADPQGATLNTTIQFGDGATSSGLNTGVYQATHTYASYTQETTFPIQVTAADSLGLQAVPALYSWTLVPTALIPPVFSGQSATVTLTLASPSGLPEQVTFQCTDVATLSGTTPTIKQASDVGISCSSNPPTITLTSKPVPVMLVIQTTGNASAAAMLRTRQRTRLDAFRVGLLVLASLGIVLTIKSRRRRLSLAFAISGLFVFAIFTVACGSGFTAPEVVKVTPSGNYQVTVIDVPVGSSSGFVQTSLIVPLTVSPFQ